MPDRHLWIRHASKQITFAGGTGTGAAGTVTVFTLTGRVYIHQMTAFCVTDLAVSGAATMTFGVAADTDAFGASITASAWDAGEWWTASTGLGAGAATYSAAAGSDATASMLNKAVSTNPILTISTADITGGVIVVDAFYTPLTDGARLA